MLSAPSVRSSVPLDEPSNKRSHRQQRQGHALPSSDRAGWELAEWEADWSGVPRSHAPRTHARTTHNAAHAHGGWEAHRVHKVRALRVLVAAVQHQRRAVAVAAVGCRVRPGPQDLVDSERFRDAKFQSVIRWRQELLPRIGVSGYAVRAGWC